MTENIFPDRDTFLGRTEKEAILKQRGVVIWFTGLSGSGKSTLALNLERYLHAKGILTQVLDGDKIRNGLNSNLEFSEIDRKENIRRVAEVAKLFSECGFVVLSAFISPTNEIRKMASDIIGDDYVEIYVNTPMEVCERRDIKGLYAKARKGIIKNFTGIDSLYEEPENPRMTIDTSEISLSEAINQLYSNIMVEQKIVIS